LPCSLGQGDANIGTQPVASVSDAQLGQASIGEETIVEDEPMDLAPQAESGQASQSEGGNAALEAVAEDQTIAVSSSDGLVPSTANPVGDAPETQPNNDSAAASVDVYEVPHEESEEPATDSVPRVATIAARPPSSKARSTPRRKTKPAGKNHGLGPKNFAKEDCTTWSETERHISA